MDTKQRQHLAALRQVYERRLNILQKQVAAFGLYAPPHILTEIEDVSQKIADIDLQFSNLNLTQQQSSERKLMTILFLSSDPTDASRLRLSEELREIQEKLQLAKMRDQFNLHQRMSLRPTDISQALLDIQPQVVHFSGHGTLGGGLCVEDNMGNVQLVDTEALASLFQQFRNQITCVILNSCYSELQAKAIARYIPYVIGMNDVIDDRASIAFAVGFYQALGAGRKIEDAFEFGSIQIRLRGLSDYVTPILIPRI
jgi:CHAT domain-containing protein